MPLSDSAPMKPGADAEAVEERIHLPEGMHVGL